MGERRDHDAGRRHQGVSYRPLQSGHGRRLPDIHGRSFSELLARPQGDRLVIRNGAPIDTTLPDYRDLDGIIESPIVFRGNPFVFGMDARSIP